VYYIELDMVRFEYLLNIFFQPLSLSTLSGIGCMGYRDDVGCLWPFIAHLEYTL
jgi:hypothetical protein